MGMIEDIGLYLQAASSLSLTIGTNLFLNYAPDNVPFNSTTGYLVSITEYPGGPPARTFTGGFQWEDARVQVMVRGVVDDPDTPRRIADKVMHRLNVGNTKLTGASTGYTYLTIEPIQSPYPMGQDNQGRLRWINNYIVQPVRAT